MSTATASPTKVITGKARLSYPHLFTPTAIDENSEKKYNTALLIPKSDTKTVDMINAAIEACKRDNASKWGGKIPATLRTPLRDGDVERPDNPEYKGHYFLNASSKQKPGVFDTDKQEVLDPTTVYAGCYVRASLNFFAYAAAGNKGVGCGLNGIMKVADGEPLGATASVSDFDDDDML